MKTVTINGQEWEVMEGEEQVAAFKSSEYETMLIRRKIEKPVPVPVLRVYFDELGWPWMLLPEEITEEIQARWIWLALAARIAAYYPEYKYMAVDANGRIYLFKKRPVWDLTQEKWCGGPRLVHILTLPEGAIPPDCSKAIVEVRHG